jgi:hypothetical protein
MVRSCKKKFFCGEICEYAINIEGKGDRWSCIVSRLTTSKQYQCFFLCTKEEGLCFGGCTCGVPKVDGIPCQHMATVVRLSQIEGLNDNNVMPTWWHSIGASNTQPILLSGATSTLKF